MSQIASLPTLVMEANGIRVPPEKISFLGEVRVQQRLSMPSLCELKFFYPVGEFPEDFPLETGTMVNLAVNGQVPELFSGQVTAVNYLYDPSQGYELRIRAYDKLHQLRKRQPVRAHVQITLPDLIRELVQDLGLTVNATQSGPLWSRIIQHDQSDLDVILEIAERCGLYITLQGSVLHVLSLEGFDAGIPLVYGKDLFEVHIEVNGDSSCRAVTTAGWNPWRVTEHEGKATVARVGRRVAAQVSPDALGSPGHTYLMNYAIQNDQQAEVIAQGELDRRSACEVWLWGMAEGNTKLRPGKRIEVKGVAAALEGQYVITSINHTIDASKGYLSEISTMPPVRSIRKSGAMVTVGTVASVEDPESLGRIQVAFPAFDNVESDWMEMVSPVAGPGKGFVTLPERGDKVLVLCDQNDAAQGVVLGCLFGVLGLPKDVAEGDFMHGYSFITPGKQRIYLDDARRRLRLEDAEGSFIELAPEHLLLHAKAQIKIEAPGQPIIIRGNTIDFEQA